MSVPFGLLAIAFVVAGAAALCARACRHESWIDGSPPFIPGWPVIGSLKFFTQRWAFLSGLRDVAPVTAFSVGPHNIVNLTGDVGREIFLTHPKFSVTKGYEVLFGVAPKPTALGEGFGSFFIRRMAFMLKQERLESNKSALVDDMLQGLDDLGDSGKTNPFQSIYRLVFRLTMRLVGCRDIAEDPQWLTQILSWYELVENSVSTTGILFPWLPTLNTFRRLYAGARIYISLKGIIDKRKKDKTREDDSLQFLIDQGDSLEDMVSVVIGSLFAGLLNTGLNCAAVLCYLAIDPENLSKVRSEIIAALDDHVDPTPQAAYEAIQSLSLSDWDSKFPFLDACLKESIRLQMPGAMLRKPMISKPEVVCGTLVQPGAYVSYPVADVHMNEDVYTEPMEYDPLRFLEPRCEDQKVPLGYLGWGAGRHPCLGMRAAQFEIKNIIALFVMRYDFSLADREGRAVRAQSIHCDINRWNGSKQEVYLHYTTRM